MPDPETPLKQYTPAQLEKFIEDHLIMALVAADHLWVDPDRGREDRVCLMLPPMLLRISDQWPTTEALEAEHKHRRNQRLMNMLHANLSEETS